MAETTIFIPGNLIRHRSMLDVAFKIWEIKSSAPLTLFGVWYNVGGQNPFAIDDDTIQIQDDRKPQWFVFSKTPA
jgi:hypothetical protein